MTADVGNLIKWKMIYSVEPTAYIFELEYYLKKQIKNEQKTKDGLTK